jgi:hypothetical protein
MPTPEQATKALAQFFSRDNPTPGHRRNPYADPPNVQRWSAGIFSISMYTKAQATKVGFATIKLELAGEVVSTLHLGSVTISEANHEYIVLKAILLRIMPLLTPVL